MNDIGCGHIEYHPGKNYWSCSNYNGDNRSAVNVFNNEYLNVTNWTRPEEFGERSDIITLVQYNKRFSFVEAVRYLHKLLSLPYSFQRKPHSPEKKFDPLDVFKRHLHKKRTDVAEIQTLDEDLIHDYIPLLHIDWLREGITERTRQKFGLCYSYKQKRIIIPHRFWMTGELLGFNMRTTVPNFEAFGVKKYCLTPGMNKSVNLYGLWENYGAIQNAGFVTVWESEKSVLKRDSLLDSTGVALSGKSISDEQMAILIGLNVDIVLALDSDVEEAYVRHIAGRLYPARNVYYIRDKWGLIPAKGCAADCPNKIFNFLMKYKTKFEVKP